MTPKCSKSVPAGGVAKHRACDECRSRKLKCSKEPDGCNRCRRERIVCHYSPQKPMGRPRKKRSLDEPSSGSPRQRLSSELGSMPSLSGDDTVAAASTAPVSFGFMEQHQAQHPDQSVGFVNMLPDTDAYAMSAAPDSTGFMSNDAAFGMQPYPLAFIDEIDPIANIEFEDRNEGSTDASKNMSHSLGRYLAAQNHAATVKPAESITSDMSNSAGSPEPLPVPPFKPIPIVSCGCLSALYLAMDELSRLPSDLFSAMRVARRASKVAHSVINCPYCSNHAMLDDPTIPPPIQSFQTRMCLAALVPTACNVYVVILEMIDVETVKAREEGRNMWFSLRDVGGLWGSIAEHPDSCPRLHDFDNRTIDPESWRRTMRAILRLDVHGLDEIPDDGHPRLRQQGLRDIVRLLDNRSNTRHELMDEWLASGQMPPHQSQCIFGMPAKSLPQEQRPCYRVLDGARMALDNLIIS